MAGGQKSFEQMVLVFGPAQRIPQGDGSYLIRPGKPVQMVTVQEACTMLGLKKTAVYRLLDMGFLTFERPAPKKTLISAESIEKHRVNSRDREFWARKEEERHGQLTLLSP